MTASVSLLGHWVYAPGKKDVKAWRCVVTGNELSSERKRGLDGKVASTKEVVEEGKQKRTPEQQATFIAQSKYKKKLDQGYSTSIPKVTDVIRNTLGFPAPQLAKSISDDFDIKTGYSWQPKLDGHRAVIAISKDGISMYSRRGKKIDTMDHILDHITSGSTRSYESMDNTIYLDGELYIHGISLQKLSKDIKKSTPNSVNIQFHIYDYFVDDQWHTQFSSRFSTIRFMQALMGLPSTMGGSTTSPLCVVDTHSVSSRSEVKVLTKKAVAAGFEGGILRNDGALYSPGIRSNGLLKIKEFDDNEYPIFEVIKGKPKHTEDTGILEQAVFKVWIDKAKGKELEVYSPGSMYEKQLHWKNRKNLIGQLVTVKHSGFTDDGIPFHAVALRIREDI